MRLQTYKYEKSKNISKFKAINKIDTNCFKFMEVYILYLCFFIFIKLALKHIFKKSMKIICITLLLIIGFVAALG